MKKRKVVKSKLSAETARLHTALIELSDDSESDLDLDVLGSSSVPTEGEDVPMAAVESAAVAAKQAEEDAVDLSLLDSDSDSDSEEMSLATRQHLLQSDPKLAEASRLVSMSKGGHRAPFQVSHAQLGAAQAYHDRLAMELQSNMSVDDMLTVYNVRGKPKGQRPKPKPKQVKEKEEMERLRRELEDTHDISSGEEDDDSRPAGTVLLTVRCDEPVFCNRIRVSLDSTVSAVLSKLHSLPKFKKYRKMELFDPDGERMGALKKLGSFDIENDDQIDMRVSDPAPESPAAPPSSSSSSSAEAAAAAAAAEGYLVVVRFHDDSLVRLRGQELKLKVKPDTRVRKLTKVVARKYDCKIKDVFFNGKALGKKDTFQSIGAQQGARLEALGV